MNAVSSSFCPHFPAEIYPFLSTVVQAAVEAFPKDRPYRTHPFSEKPQNRPYRAQAHSQRPWHVRTMKVESSNDARQCHASDGGRPTNAPTLPSVVGNHFRGFTEIFVTCSLRTRKVAEACGRLRKVKKFSAAMKFLLRPNFARHRLSDRYARAMPWPISRPKPGWRRFCKPRYNFGLHFVVIL